MTGIEERFAVSRHPKRLEWYRCFEDLSKDRPVDGSELFEHRHVWDERIQLKWKFFYRPVRAWVGRPQKKMIGGRKARILAAESQLVWLKHELVKSSVLAGIGIVLGLWIWEFLALLPLVYGLSKGIQFLRMKARIERNVEQWRGDVAALGKEIDFLLEQVWEPPTLSQVEDLLQEEMRALEKICLAEIVNDSGGNDEALFQNIRHAPITGEHNRYGLNGLLVEGWGAVQPSTVRGPFGKEKTGLQRVVKDLQANVATFRVGTDGRVVSRVPYLQFIFLLENNVNVYALFYDFVTGKKYGKRGETFQYSHVTNYSIRDIEPEESELVRNIQLPAMLHHKIFGEEISAFSLGVASGAYFQCVLLDDVLADGINDWLKTDAAYRSLEQELEGLESGARDDGKEAGHGIADPKKMKQFEKMIVAGREAFNEAFDSWRTDEREAMERELERLAAERSQLEARGVHVARRVLQQIREEIEEHIRRISGRAGDVFAS